MNRDIPMDIHTSYPTQKELIKIKLMLGYFLTSNHSIKDDPSSHYITITNKKTNINTILYWSAMLYAYIMPSVLEYAHEQGLFRNETERDNQTLGIVHYWYVTGKNPTEPLWNLFVTANKIEFEESDMEHLVDITNAKYEADKAIKRSTATVNTENLRFDFENKAIPLPESTKVKDLKEPFYIKKTKVTGFTANNATIEKVSVNYSKQML